MGAMVLSAQPKAKAESKNKEGLLTAEVTVAIDSVAALPPYLAYDELIDEAATLHGVDPDLVHAVIETESGFNALAESPAGAQGLMQLMPALQAELGVTDAFDPRQNIMAGVQYLKKLLQRHNGDIALALASYNAGPTIVGRYKGVPPYRETRNYIKKIKALLAAAASD
jgi:soluble lytic murein transglycosylase-like protein